MSDRLIAADAGGHPVIAGTHVTVEAVLKELAACDEAFIPILTAHPELDRAAVQAALEFAAENVHRTANVLPTPAFIQAGHFVPKTEFGKELWALRQKAVEELHAQNETLLDLEGIRAEVRARRGERDYGVDQ